MARFAAWRRNKKNRPKPTFVGAVKGGEGGNMIKKERAARSKPRVPPNKRMTCFWQQWICRPGGGRPLIASPQTRAEPSCSCFGQSR